MQPREQIAILPTNYERRNWSDTAIATSSCFTWPVHGVVSTGSLHIDTSASASRYSEYVRTRSITRFFTKKIFVADRTSTRAQTASLVSCPHHLHNQIYVRWCCIDLSNAPRLSGTGRYRSQTSHDFQATVFIVTSVVGAFPTLRDALEQAANEHGSLEPPYFQTVKDPIHTMMREHDAAGDLVRQIRVLSSEYTPPGDAFTSFKALYEALREFEADLHQHVHLENISFSLVRWSWKRLTHQETSGLDSTGALGGVYGPVRCRAQSRSLSA